MDQRFEPAVISVSDVDRTKAFYGKLRWRLDADATAGDSFRIVELTPPGSECSVQFGTNMAPAAPGSAQGMYLIVSDLPAARDELAARGVEVTEVFYEGTPGGRFLSAGTSGRVSGPAPDRARYGSFATRSDPDWPGWYAAYVVAEQVGTALPT